MNGASEMDYPSIKDLSAGKLASLMTDREPEFMRKVLGVENDFTEEEYAKICEENKWAEEATKIDFWKKKKSKFRSTFKILNY